MDGQKYVERVESCQMASAELRTVVCALPHYDTGGEDALMRRDGWDPQELEPHLKAARIRLYACDDDAHIAGDGSDVISSARGIKAFEH